MSITTNLVQLLLLVQMTVFIFLLLPLPQWLKKQSLLFFKSSKLLRSLLHILIALYAMIFLMFVDSMYKIYKHKEEDGRYFLYHDERNFYLSGFTLFLALIFNRFVSMLILLYKEEETALLLKKQALNQQTFVENLVKKNTEKDTELNKLKLDSKELSRQIVAGEVMIKQLKNNQNEYFCLLEKYNELKEKVSMESKKSK